uniref:Cytochrome P450 monooxygenase pc-2 n=1 Tax=Phanerodontia chrysosporium TaxID=2822231 RepID=Q8NJK3_PHACH|nr:cytochrome P450 monooxygenase pc-2 [Phanerodontia chrysosporium]
MLVSVDALALRTLVYELTYLLYPAVPTAAALILLQRFGNVWLPTWTIVLLSLCNVPVAHRILVWLKDGRRWPGSIDLLRQLTQTFETGFLSEMLWGYMHVLGQTFEVYILWDSNYVTSDANVIKTILATDFDNFVKGEKLDVCVRPVLGTGVFNSDGEMWKFHRSMTRPFFTRERISHFDLFDRHADATMAKMKARLAEGFAVDFQDLISRFTLDSATEFLFGQCTTGASRTEDFARAFAEAQDAVSFRLRMGWLWPDAVARADKIKRENGGRVPEVKGEIEEDETLLDHLVNVVQTKILHDEVLNIMIAGRDTTGGTLTSAVYFLSQYPEVLRRLREEILEKVGPTRRPTYDDIREMKYLRAFINETLRLYPAVPWNVRYPVKDTTIPGPHPDKPYFIPANTPVSYSVHCMHRRTDYWGPDAEAFDPDRFLDARVQRYLTPNPFIFLPFNAGPRICLGQQFAYNEMSFFVIRLLQHFDEVQLCEDALAPDCRVPDAWRGAPGRKGVERFWPKAHLTLYAKGGLWVKMREASTSEAVV